MSEQLTKKMYDTFGRDYQRTRNEKHPSRLYNDHLEVPCMLKAVGKIKGKKLLDVGCGAGIHISKYLKKGATCSGVDISKTMLELAKANCPKTEFKQGSMLKLPYKNSSFNIVTASLCIHYLRDFSPFFKEARRVLNNGGLLYYSSESVVFAAREKYKINGLTISGVGRIKDNKTGKTIGIGQSWKIVKDSWDMVPGMHMQTYDVPLRNQLLWLRKTGFELIDVIDCKPTLWFKKHDLEAYNIFNKFPIFSIFVARKKNEGGEKKKTK